MYFNGEDKVFLTNDSGTNGYQYAKKPKKYEKKKKPRQRFITFIQKNKIRLN